MKSSLKGLLKGFFFSFLSGHDLIIKNKIRKKGEKKKKGEKEGKGKRKGERRTKTNKTKKKKKKKKPNNKKKTSPINQKTPLTTNPNHLSNHFPTSKNNLKESQTIFFGI